MRFMFARPCVFASLPPSMHSKHRHSLETTGWRSNMFFLKIGTASVTKFIFLSKKQHAKPTVATIFLRAQSTYATYLSEVSALTQVA